LADDFVATMNRAAEEAVPEAAAVLAQSVQQMTVTEVKAILTGTNNAATQYFRRTSETDLLQKVFGAFQEQPHALVATLAKNRRKRADRHS
jgi:hypothetical protein